MFFVIIWNILMSLGNVFWKMSSVNFWPYKALFIKYFLTSFLWIILLIYSWELFFVFNYSNVMYLLLLWLIGYLWMLSFLIAMKTNNAWIVTIVAYTYVFFSYYLNIYILWWQESFSYIKLFLWVVYFVLICFFVFKRWNNKEIKINYSILLPIVTAISWTGYYVLSNYLIKNNILTPLQNISYWEISTLIFAFVVFVSNTKLNWKWFWDSIFCSFNNLKIYWAYAFFIFTWVYMSFIWYKYISWNIVNFVSLSTVVLTSIFAWFILKERISRLEIVLILLSFLILIGFVIL